ncbi:MAG TPA: RecQ family zinc-binding domain-containing protein [Actinomycetota bacterium]|jgi:ATP-dependent DNA helicase RecQ|nr:RecQ family zinc-binding domain-containing protein [Actinomycetota bacterium]
MVRGYAEATSCRRRFLLTYFGEDYEAPCNNCDNCERGAPQPDPPTGEEFAINAKVRHAKFGDGHVVRHDGDRVVVLFEDAGYKTLSASMMAASNLLEETR